MKPFQKGTGFEYAPSYLHFVCWTGPPDYLGYWVPAPLYWVVYAYRVVKIRYLRLRIRFWRAKNAWNGV